MKKTEKCRVQEADEFRQMMEQVYVGHPDRVIIESNGGGMVRPLRASSVGSYFGSWASSSLSSSRSNV